jgi:hypothetical protein
MGGEVYVDAERVKKNNEALEQRRAEQAAAPGQWGQRPMPIDMAGCTLLTDRQPSDNGAVVRVALDC